jgi:fluoroacetyl-CoA thioesterase
MNLRPYGGPVSIPPPGARLVFDVTTDDTARALGSGDVDVLATPRLLAWCEAATCVAASSDDAAAAGVPVGDGSTSVGTRIRLEHHLPTPVGGQVTVQARIAAVDGRLVRFEVVATDRHGGVIATGDVTRVVVDRGRFAGRIPPP